jgi:hypothetical protein
MLKDREVHILIVSHRHGTDYHVAESEKLARWLLYGYVKRWWDDGCETLKMPQGRDKAIKLYFDEIRSDESWEIVFSVVTTAGNIRRHEKGLA